ncbi:MAG TPA: VIT1/CCC1 transporter family protein [Nitrososphaerales archaeon]|nr:VIT1/CCC1 transporter family protein [Nitrososphaerales archaeon]
MVLGGSDGAIESLAMTAALNGAGVSFQTILLAGFAFSVAGAISMFFSNYLSARAEIDSLRIDMERERMEIETEPEEEKGELESLLQKEGYGKKEIDVIMARLVKDKEMWLREQLRHELHLYIEDLGTDPVSKSASAGVAFFLLAIVALSPYAFRLAHLPALAASAALSLAALFILGSKVFTLRNFTPKSGLESAAIGALAGGLLYVAGLFISTL